MKIFSNHKMRHRYPERALHHIVLIVCRLVFDRLQLVAVVGHCWTVILLRPFMQNIFKLRTSCYSLRSSNNSAYARPNDITFGPNSLKSIRPQIWNSLPNDVKSAENLKNVKRLMKNWMDPLVDAVFVSACLYDLWKIQSYLFY